VPPTVVPPGSELAAVVPPTTVPPTTSEERSVFDAECVVQTNSGDSLDRIALRSGQPIAPASLWAENGFGSRRLETGDLVDVCVDNQLDDITGESRPERTEAVVAAAVRASVERQQNKLNSLFSGLGSPNLVVDGESGPVTRQRLCAARLALGLPATTSDMRPGSDEELTFLATETLPTPATTAVRSEQWIIIDRTCQMMFIGNERDLTYVFPTSTGSEGFETRDQDRTNAFRFDPALENEGWHNSSEYPVGIDNPLNGNLYKPLYFDLGQAIHGANNVPTSPASKGCARLRVQDQDTLLGWLGLTEANGPVWDASQLNVTVNVQGEYIAP
jgi:hypothetical protein